MTEGKAFKLPVGDILFLLVEAGDAMATSLFETWFCCVESGIMVVDEEGEEELLVMEARMLFGEDIVINCCCCCLRFCSLFCRLEVKK